MQEAVEVTERSTSVFLVVTIDVVVTVGAVAAVYIQMAVCEVGLAERVAVAAV